MPLQRTFRSISPPPTTTDRPHAVVKIRESTEYKDVGNGARRPHGGASEVQSCVERHFGVIFSEIYFDVSDFRIIFVRSKNDTGHLFGV